jgi:hypothetical protein
MAVAAAAGRGCIGSEPGSRDMVPKIRHITHKRWRIFTSSPFILPGGEKLLYQVAIKQVASSLRLPNYLFEHILVLGHFSRQLLLI